MTHLREHQPLKHTGGTDTPSATSGTTRPAPRLTVVGAGIGDPDLITLKGVEALRTADVVLYDALVNEAILQHTRPTTALVYVGKRKGAKAYSQEEINERIVAYAHCCGHVVRLKGGDPYVFGRGHEELQYAQQHGLQTAYVPGVSSAIAGAGAAGIAVTLRGASRGFWVITGTTDTGDLNPEIRTAANTDATLVILMGVSKIAEIAEVFKAAGKPGTPVAVIQNATLPHQREVISNISEVAAAVKNSGVDSPAVIVIGEVVQHRLLSNEAKALADFLKPEYAAQ